MTKNVVAICLFLSLSLTGCAELYKAAYPHEYQKQQEMLALDQAKAGERECERLYAEADEFSAIRPMISYKPEDASFAQLSNSSKPTKKEKTQLEAFDAMSQRCFSAYMTFFKEFNPKWRINLAEAYQQNQRGLLLQLWSGKLTYGQYGEKRIKLQQLRNQIVEEEQQKRRAGMANDLLMMQAMGAFSAPSAATPVVSPQRPFNTPGTPINPIQTKCTGVGGSVNCQTYSN